jgi:HD-like signal output (HDOD) protein
MQESFELELQCLVEEVDNSELASIKTVVGGIVRIINDPRSSARDLKEMVEVDPPLTAKILKLANSAYYNSPKTISDIEQAIVWIGFNAIKELALNQKVCELFASGAETGDYSRLRLWEHSVGVAICGKILSKMALGNVEQNMYAAGLLHDMGIIVEDQFRSESFIKILEYCKDESNLFDLIHLEKDILGYDHGELGGYLSDSWNFPQPLAMAITWHHNPLQAPLEYRPLVSLLYVADYLCQEAAIGFQSTPFRNAELYSRCIGFLNLKRKELDLVAEQVRAEITKMKEQGFF